MDPLSSDSEVSYWKIYSATRGMRKRGRKGWFPGPVFSKSKIPHLYPNTPNFLILENILHAWALYFPPLRKISLRNLITKNPGQFSRPPRHGPGSQGPGPGAGGPGPGPGAGGRGPGPGARGPAAGPHGLKTCRARALPGEVKIYSPVAPRSPAPRPRAPAPGPGPRAPGPGPGPGPRPRAPAPGPGPRPRPRAPGPGAKLVL